MTDSREPLSEHRKHLGEQRMDEFFRHNSTLQFMQLALNISVIAVPGTDYADDALEALKRDAKDLLEAASEYAAWAERLADEWRAQRQERDEPLL
jgi:5'-3' exonuclease